MGSMLLRQDQCGYISPHPLMLNFQTPQNHSQVSEHTQEFLFPPVVPAIPSSELCINKTLFLDSPSDCSSDAHPKGVSRTSFCLILCVVLKILWLPHLKEPHHSPLL